MTKIKINKVRERYQDRTRHGKETMMERAASEKLSRQAERYESLTIEQASGIVGMREDLIHYFLEHGPGQPFGNDAWCARLQMKINYRSVKEDDA